MEAKTAALRLVILSLCAKPNVSVATAEALINIFLVFPLDKCFLAFDKINTEAPSVIGEQSKSLSGYATIALDSTCSLVMRFENWAWEFNDA